MDFHWFKVNGFFINMKLGKIKLVTYCDVGACECTCVFTGNVLERDLPTLTRLVIGHLPFTL